MRLLTMLLISFSLLGSDQVDVEIAKPADIKQAELHLPLYVIKDNNRLTWVEAKLFIVSGGLGPRPNAWIITDGKPERIRTHIDTRLLQWQQNKLTGQLSYRGALDDSRLVLNLDAHLSGSDISGTYQIHHSRGTSQKQRDVSKKEGAITGLIHKHTVLQQRNAINPDTSWPGWRGGFHAGVADNDMKQDLIEDLRDSRFVWQSDTPTPMPGHTDDRLLGGYGEITVGGGRLYINYYIGHGDHYPKGLDESATVAAIKATAGKKPGRGLDAYITNYFSGDTLAYVRAKMPILGTDVVECYDAATGACLWRSSFPGRGINWRNCDGPHFYPAYDNDRLYIIGSAGRLYGLNASTGQKLWESELPGARPSTKWRAEVLAAAKDGKDPSKHCSSRDLVNKPLALDGVVVVAERGLCGVDGTSGKKLWGPLKEVSNGNPRPWRHQGQSYVLCRTRYGRAAGQGGLVCVELKTGKLLWHDQRLPGGSKEYANDDTYLFSAGIGIPKGGKDGDTIYAPTCFKISTQGLEKLWSLPQISKEPRMGAPVLYKGHVYTIWDGVWESGMPRQSFIVCVEAATGKVIGKSPLSEPGRHKHKTWQGLVAGSDRLFYLLGQGMQATALCSTGPGFRCLQDDQHPWRMQGMFQVLSPVLVDGRLFMREKGESQASVSGSRIYCFDLRKQ